MIHDPGTITVWHNQQALLVWKPVAAALGLEEHERLLTEERFWEVLTLNCKYGIALCQREIKLEKDVN